MPDLELVERVRAVTAGLVGVREVRMFGGLGFMLNENLFVAASARGLLARVGRDAQAEALAEPGASPMVMRGRTMEGYIRVEPEGLSDEALGNWVSRSVAYVTTLPPGAGKRPPSNPKTRRGT